MWEHSIIFVGTFQYPCIVNCVRFQPTVSTYQPCTCPAHAYAHHKTCVCISKLTVLGCVSTLHSSSVHVYQLCIHHRSTVSAAHEMCTSRALCVGLSKASALCVIMCPSPDLYIKMFPSQPSLSECAHPCPLCHNVHIPSPLCCNVHI